MENRDVTLTCKGFPSVGVWLQSQKQMPRSCASSHGSAAATTSALTAELKDKYGEQHLKAGETFQAGYTITIGRIRTRKKEKPPKYSEKNTIPVTSGVEILRFL